MSWARYVDILGGETSTSSGSDQAFYKKKRGHLQYRYYKTIIKSFWRQLDHRINFTINMILSYFKEIVRENNSVKWHCTSVSI